MAQKVLTFKDLWYLIRVPILIIVLWNIAAVITAAVSIDAYSVVFGQWAGIVVTLLVFSFIGYRITGEANACCLSAAKAGVWAGAIAGFFSALISILGILFVPDLLSYAVSQAVSSGLDRGIVEGMYRMTMWFNLIITPIFYALLGAGLAALAGWVTKKGMKK